MREVERFTFTRSLKKGKGYIGEARRDKFIEVFGRFEQFEELWLIIFKKILSFCKKVFKRNLMICYRRCSWVTIDK